MKYTDDENSGRESDGLRWIEGKREVLLLVLRATQTEELDRWQVESFP